MEIPNRCREHQHVPRRLEVAQDQFTHSTVVNLV
jgi:hypothetical protein